MKTRPAVPWLVGVLLLVLGFGLGAGLDVRLQEIAARGQKSVDPLAILLGDGRRLLANHFFVKADIYFHSGNYPTIFDNREAYQTPHLAEDAGAVAGRNEGDESGFLGPPRDWIDRLSRNFFPAVHTHLDAGGAAGAHAHAEEEGDIREILPWLKFSAMLDPQQVETYVVTAYWLRQRLGKVRQAEEFLREGLRSNPDSHELWFELGRIYFENHGDLSRARQVWERALLLWRRHEAAKPEPNQFLWLQIVSHLAALEERAGDVAAARHYLQLWRQASPNPEDVQKRIDELNRIRPNP